MSFTGKLVVKFFSRKTLFTEGAREAQKKNIMVHGNSAMNPVCQGGHICLIFSNGPNQKFQLTRFSLSQVRENSETTDNREQSKRSIQALEEHGTDFLGLHAQIVAVGHFRCHSGG